MLRSLLPLAILASAAAFQSPGLLLRSTSARSATSALNGVRMESGDTFDVSRRTFFKGVAGAGALTVGSLGLEVPQSFADGLPGVNAPAPDFSLPSNRGKDVSLKDLGGKWAVLYFYPGDFTSGCTIEAQNFEKKAADIRALGAEIYGVSVDTMEKHLDFAKQYGLSFTLLSDAGGKVSDAYGSALKIPFIGTFSNRQTYLIDPEGNLRWVFTGVQDRLAQHADEVVEKIKELTKA